MFEPAPFANVAYYKTEYCPTCKQNWIVVGREKPDIFLFWTECPWCASLEIPIGDLYDDTRRA